jgi:hypothetical protein
MRPKLPIPVKEEATKITPGGENVGRSLRKKLSETDIESGKGKEFMAL